MGKFEFTDSDGNFTKFAENESVGTSFEDIWTNGGNYTFLSVGFKMKLNHYLKEWNFLKNQISK